MMLLPPPPLSPPFDVALRPSTSSSSLGSGNASGMRPPPPPPGSPGQEVGEEAEAKATVGRAARMALLAVACLGGSMVLSSETLQLGGTALFWPCTPIAALFLALNPPWMQRWLAAAMLLTYVLMVLLDYGKVRGALFLNVLFLLTDTAEVLSVTLCLGVLLPSGPPSLIRTGAALNAIMLFPLLLAPLKGGLNCLLIYICYSALHIPLWETLLIWLIGDFFMDFFVVYAVLVVRYYWLGRKGDGGGGGGGGSSSSSSGGAANSASQTLAKQEAAAAAAAAGGSAGGEGTVAAAAAAAAAAASVQDAMDEAEAGRAVKSLPAAAAAEAKAQMGGRQQGAPAGEAAPPPAPAPANAWASCCGCCDAYSVRLSATVERVLGPSAAQWLATPRALADAVLFIFLLAVVAVTSFASILNTSSTAKQPLFYLSSRLLFPVIGYVTVRYGQLGACLNVTVAVMSMLVTDFVVDKEQQAYGSVSVSSFGSLFQVLVCPLLVVTVAWSISYLAVALAERQDTLLLLEEKNAQLVAQGRELREAKQAAEAALSSKTEFFARVSHEFRTPLNVVLGFSEELTKCPDLALTPETADRIHYILAAGESLLRVVDDILELFRLSSASSRGRLRIHLTGVDIPGFFGTVCDLVEAIAQENGQHFIRFLDPSLPRYLYLDRVRFSQLVMNLASNACKYSRPAGGVVSIRLINDGPAPGRPGHITLRLDVQDNGPGIPPELKERIFESFFRAGDPTAPCDHHAHAHAQVREGGERGGMAAAATSPVMGSRAGVGGRPSPPTPLATALGLTASSPASPQALPLAPLHPGGGGGAGIGGAAAGGRGDGLSPGLALSSKAKGHGLGLAITKQLVDLLEGRIVVQSSLGLGSLFTIYLPARVADGCTAEGEEERWTTAAGEDERGGGAAVDSASAAASMAASSLAAGGVGPAGAARAGAAGGAGATAAVLGGPGQGSGMEAEWQPQAPVRELRILSVEDILVNQIVLGGMLQQDGHSVAFVETGGAALTAVHDAQAQQDGAAAAPFDVVLLDLQLPDMHGIDVLKAIRADADPGLAALPVVVVSALALDREKQECALAGADGFITKPVKLSLLRRELRRLWETGRLRRARDAGGKAAADG
jgi:signal transduction histidine kinase